uniref:Methyltransferase FkbM domain-containing protein n=1 Tax=viral metagenome TaxID=1070528 RepID=A0A6C0KR00_9ZZZZ
MSPQEVVIIYDISSAIEADYIKELFGEYKYRFTPVTTNSFLTPEIFKDINKLVVCFSTNVIAYEIIRNFCIVVKPKIIIALADEGGDRKHFNELAKYTMLYLSQYNNYEIEYPNMRTIPLGYAANMMKNFKGSLIPSSKRPILYSFVGNINKSKRSDILKTIEEAWVMPFVRNNISPEEMRDVYMSSVFVPNLRGWVTQDCFRLYESSICGCIPVVVGDAKELRKTFSYVNVLPPWIFANTWEEAIKKCKALYEDEEKLNEKQFSILKWWQYILSSIKFIIRHTLEDYHFYSQEGQDQFLINLDFIKYKNNGVFVDIGANDGVKFSNTKLLEDIGWDGVCVEPLPETFEKLRQNRKCDVFNVAISEKEGEIEFQQIIGEAEMLSGILDAFDERHTKRIEQEIKDHGGETRVIKVKSIPFSKLIDRKNIDYLSIDVEGAEMNVLRSIDFSKHNITLISIENNYETEEISNFMKEKGYTRVAVIGHDWFFFHETKF